MIKSITIASGSQNHSVNVVVDDEGKAIIDWLISRNAWSSFRTALDSWFESKKRSMKEEERDEVLSAIEHLSSTDKAHLTEILARGNANRSRNLATGSGRPSSSNNPTPVRVESSPEKG